MKKIFVAGWLVYALARIWATADQPEEHWMWGSNDLPAGIKITLESDRTNYFLGENILLYYHIENTGSNAFKISVGGDYRGSSRADRFKVTATAADGKPVTDPTPVVMNFGGLMPNSEIKPGSNWFESIHVIEYCRFDEPGSYTIHAFHDLGFGKKHDVEPRETSMTIKLQAPTEEQARAILVEDETAKPYNGNTWGQKGEARLDYHCLRWPTFLQPLIERAQNGHQNAVEGIASIHTLEATRALVDLLSSEIPKQAAAFLEWRLPHSTNEFQGNWGEMRRQLFVENAWDDTFAPPVRAFALQLLARTSHADFLLATKLLRRIGTQREVPALMKAIEFAVTQTNAEFLADISYPSPIRVCDALLGTVLAIDTNLNLSADEIRTAGQSLLFIARHSGGERALTKDEAAAFAKLMRHKLPYVRMKALENLPKEIPPLLAELVTERMTDSNVGVQNYAFLAAERMQEPRHCDIALAVLKSTTDDQWLGSAAHRLALKYGARYECAMGWASRLVVPKDINDYATHRALQHLFEITVGRGPNGGFTPRLDPASAQALRERWEKFLTANKNRIQAGHTFQLGDKDMPADLLPGGWNF
jgi:hypothetical protein